MFEKEILDRGILVILVVRRRRIAGGFALMWTEKCGIVVHRDLERDVEKIRQRNASYEDTFQVKTNS